MSNCVYCGGMLDPSKNYCVYCDSPVDWKTEAAETGENEEMNEAESYAETTYDSTTEQEESGWTDKAKNAGTVLGTVLGAALGASLLGKRHRKPMPKQPPMKQAYGVPPYSKPVQRVIPRGNGMPAGQMHNAPGGKPMGNPQGRGMRPGSAGRPGGTHGAAGGIGRNTMGGPGGRGGHGSGGPMGRH